MFDAFTLKRVCFRGRGQENEMFCDFCVISAINNTWRTGFACFAHFCETTCASIGKFGIRFASS